MKVEISERRKRRERLKEVAVGSEKWRRHKQVHFD